VANSGHQKILAEHWTGTTWAIQSIPNPASNVAFLTGVSCSAVTACTAAGYYQTTSGVQKTLAERYGP
jgi:hypothetical protein